MDLKKNEALFWDRYLNSSSLTPAELAQNTSLNESEADLWLAAIRKPGQVLRNESVPAVSHHVRQYILRKASEALAHGENWVHVSEPSFLEGVVQTLRQMVSPRFAMALCSVAVLSIGLTHFSSQESGSTTANATNSHLETPLDIYAAQNSMTATSTLPSYPVPSINRASPASLGETPRLEPESDELDRKMVTGMAMTDHELESLFFRARKYERLGHYHEALRDYQFLSRFVFGFENQKVLQFAIAKCLNRLEEKNQALRVLERFENAYGTSEDVKLLKDEVKSVSF